MVVLPRVRTVGSAVLEQPCNCVPEPRSKLYVGPPGTAIDVMPPPSTLTATGEAGGTATTATPRAVCSLIIERRRASHIIYRE